MTWVEENAGAGFWAVTRHADVETVSRDFGRFTASRGIRIEQMEPDALEARRTMMEFDPPEHARLRRLVQPGFTPKVVATYEEAFRALAGLVLDKVLPLGEFDFVTEISASSRFVCCAGSSVCPRPMLPGSSPGETR